MWVIDLVGRLTSGLEFIWVDPFFTSIHVGPIVRRSCFYHNNVTLWLRTLYSASRDVSRVLVHQCVCSSRFPCLFSSTRVVLHVNLFQPRTCEFFQSRLIPFRRLLSGARAHASLFSLRLVPTFLITMFSSCRFVAARITRWSLRVGVLFG